MSWSTSGKSLTAKQIHEIPAPNWESYGDQELVPSMQEQFEAARLAAYAIVVTGALGKDKLFNVALSGHGNLDHEPKDGWVNDFVTISISQVGSTVPKEEYADTAA